MALGKRASQCTTGLAAKKLCVPAVRARASTAKRPAAAEHAKQQRRPRRISIRKRPMAATAKTQVSSRVRAISHALTSLRRLQHAVPKGGARAVLTRTMRALRKKHPKEIQAADALLKSVLSEVANSLEQEVEQAQAAVDAAASRRSAALASAKEATAAVRASRVEAKKTIEVESKGILVAKEEQKKASASCKALDNKIAELQDAKSTAFQPLKDASVKGSDASKSLRQLNRVAVRNGFHEGLLGVMAQALKRSLSRRQTFDNMVVQSLDKEFSKHSEQLSLQLQDGRRQFEEHGKAVEEKKEAVAQAKVEMRQGGRNVAVMKSALHACGKAHAKDCASISSVKKAARHLKQIQSKNAKLLAAISKYGQYSAAFSQVGS